MIQAAGWTALSGWWMGLPDQSPQQKPKENLPWHWIT